MGRVQHADPVGRRIEAPLGGVPPPKVFGVGRVAIRTGVWKKKAWKDLSFPEGVRTDFLLGFVLGRFLDSRLCLRQVLGFSWQSWLKANQEQRKQEQPKTCTK